MKRWFLNPDNLAQIVLQYRLRSLESLAGVEAVDGPKEIDGRIFPGEYIHYAVFEDSVLTDEQINILLATPQTAEETAAITDYTNSITDFDTIPNWATMSANDLVAAINAAFFNSLTQAQVQVTIDGIDTFPKLRSALTTLLTELYKTKDREIKHVLATAYMRDRLMRLRK